MAELTSLLKYYLRQLTLLSSDRISQVKSLYIEGVFTWLYTGQFCYSQCQSYPSCLHVAMNDKYYTDSHTTTIFLPGGLYNLNHRCMMEHQVL